MKVTLRTQFLVPCIIALGLGLGGLSYWGYDNTNKAVQDSVAGQLQQAARGLATSGSGWFADRGMDVMGWAADPLYAKSLLSTFVGRATRRAANERLTMIKAGYDYYETIGLVDSAGNVVASSDASQLGRNLKNQELFSAGGSGGSFLTDAVAMEGSDIPVVTAAAPVISNGEEAGMLYAVISLDYFNERFVAPVRVGETGRALLFNRAGLAIIHPDSANVMNLNIGTLIPQADIGQAMASVIDYTDGAVQRKASVMMMDGLGWTVIIEADQ